MLLPGISTLFKFIDFIRSCVGSSGRSRSASCLSFARRDSLSRSTPLILGLGWLGVTLQASSACPSRQLLTLLVGILVRALVSRIQTRSFICVAHDKCYLYLLY